MVEDQDQKQEIIDHDATNEQVLIAGMCVDDDIRSQLIRILRTDLFWVDKHRSIFNGMVELHRKKLSFDLAALQKIDSAIDVGYLNLLIDARPEPPSPTNLQFHIDALFWDYARLEAARGSLTALIEAIRDPRTDPDKVKALARQVSGSFEGYDNRHHLHDPEELIRDQMRDIQERRAGRAIYPIGIPDLDLFEDGSPRLMPGTKPGLTTIVTGVPGSGKSTFTARIVLALARQKRRILYGAWEMTGGITIELLACMALGWSRTKCTRGEFTDDEVAQIEITMRAISKYVRFMKNPFRRKRKEKLMNDANLDLIHEYIEDTGCDVFVADLWKRCLKQTKPDDEEDALLRQQAMAEECHIHQILVQQQRSKDIEQRADKKPTREGIKGSGAWTEIGDNIFGVHRPALWKSIPDDKIEIDILKQRYGVWPLAVEFDWVPDLGSITNGKPIKYDQPTATGNEMSSVGGRFKAPQRRGRRDERDRN
jgi:replicative DNA helicase